MRDEARAWAIEQIERFLPAGDDPLVPFADGETAPVIPGLPTHAFRKRASSENSA